MAAFASSASAQTGDAPNAERVARGEYLAYAGDCVACHTAKGGKPLAGGLGIETPYGPISAPNITPDRDTGIGAWTDEQFYRAVHEGIGRHGEFLYPAMPFPWYSIVTRDDVMAIRAWLQTQPAVHNVPPPSKLRFPYNVRGVALLAWRQAFFKPTSFKPDPAQTAEVNRGAYLVNGLAHCGECHNARPVAGTSRWRQSLRGGVVDNWYAPNITSDVRTGIGGWSNAEIAGYLKTGIAPGKGIAAGPMAETVHSLSHLQDADLLAIAAYLKTTPPTTDKQPQGSFFNGAEARGGDAYLNYCASCHGLDGKGLAGVIPALAGSGSVTAKGPQNVISVVLGGLEARQTYAPMLAIGAGMSDAEVADVVNYVRQNWGNAAPATAAPGMVAKLRKGADTLLTAAPKSGCTALATQAPGRLLAADRYAPQAAFGGIGETDLPQRAQDLVARAQKSVPGASQAELINGLTVGYCQVVRADRTLDARAKALRLGHFSELVYTAASGHPVK